MARLVMLCLIVLGACSLLHSTLARSAKLARSPYITSESNYRDLVSSGGGDFTLEKLVAQRILISRANSTLEEFGFMGDISQTSVWSASLLSSNPAASAAFSKLLLSPSDNEIQEALAGLVRDYREFRKRVTELDKEEALLVKEMEARLGTTLPPTPAVTPPPYPEARFFFIFSTVPPEVNTEGLAGMVAIAEDVKQGAEEENFLAKLQGNMFINSIITTYSFVAVEFLNSIGLGDITTVGTLVADTWLYYELFHQVREWAERDCYLPSAWPFHYFLPEHCRLYFEEQKAAARRRKEQQNASNAAGAASESGAASGAGADNGDNNGAGSGSSAANGNNDENGADAENGENGSGVANGAGADNGENGSGAENGGANGSGAENGGENGSGVASGAGAENGGDNGSGAENGAAEDEGVAFDAENSDGDANAAEN